MVDSNWESAPAMPLPSTPPSANRSTRRRVRKARLAEAVVILRRLLDGEEVTFAGERYLLAGVRTKRALQPILPIMVGVNGRGLWRTLPCMPTASV